MQTGQAGSLSAAPLTIPVTLGLLSLSAPSPLPWQTKVNNSTSLKGPVQNLNDCVYIQSADTAWCIIANAL